MNTPQPTLPPPDPAAVEGALIVIPRAELVFVPGGAEKVLSSIREKARKEAADLDVSRPRDREAMRSLAYKLRRLKTTGDELGKDLKDQYQQKIVPIDAERRVWRSEMDELIAEIIAPADEFDARAAERVARHERAISEIMLFGARDRDLSAAELSKQLDDLDHLHPARDWEEFQGRADAARTATRNAMRLALIDAQASEAAEAEAARLAAEEAKRQRQEAARLQAEREAEIARQAAETARIVAETAAAEEAARVAAEAAERERAAAEAAQAERDRIEREAREAAARAEAEAKAAEERAAAALKAEQQRAAQAERDRVAAEERAKQAAAQAEAARIAAAQKAERDRLAAIEAERARVEGERIQQEMETRRREADKAHRAKINREARDAIQKVIGNGLEQIGMAQAIVEAIAKGGIPNVRISYG